jgi:hypothetical protein
VIVPFFGDQPFWGSMVAAAGAGPEPIPHKQLDSKNLAEAISFCLSEEARAAAQTMAGRMQTENGVQEAVRSFHRHLEVDKLRCDLIPSRPAAWRLKKGKVRLKLSNMAAGILVDNLLATWDQLER